MSEEASNILKSHPLLWIKTAMLASECTVFRSVSTLIRRKLTLLRSSPGPGPGPPSSPHVLRSSDMAMKLQSPVRTQSFRTSWAWAWAEA